MRCSWWKSWTKSNHELLWKNQRWTSSSRVYSVRKSSGNVRPCLRNTRSLRSPECSFHHFKKKNLVALSSSCSNCKETFLFCVFDIAIQCPCGPVGSGNSYLWPLRNVVQQPPQSDGISSRRRKV